MFVDFLWGMLAYITRLEISLFLNKKDMKRLEEKIDQILSLHEPKG